jgi:hypothetical protein
MLCEVSVAMVMQEKQNIYVQPSIASVHECEIWIPSASMEIKRDYLEL